MLYMRDRDAIVKRFFSFIEEIQNEPICDASELPFELGCPTWYLSVDSGFSIHYEPQTTAEAMLVQEDGVYYLTTDGRETFLDSEKEVFLSREAAVARREELIDTMDWETLFDSLKYLIRYHEEDAAELLDRIRPLYKEITETWALEGA